MSLIERYEQGEPFGDLLAEADTKLLALENDGMELAAKLGDAEHQLQGAVSTLTSVRVWAEIVRDHNSDEHVRRHMRTLLGLLDGEDPDTHRGAVAP
jgi:hypothetical protein